MRERALLGVSDLTARETCISTFVCCEMVDPVNLIGGYPCILLGNVERILE
jgi:hypothetical protein